MNLPQVSAEPKWNMFDVVLTFGNVDEGFEDVNVVFVGFENVHEVVLELENVNVAVVAGFNNVNVVAVVMGFENLNELEAVRFLTGNFEYLNVLVVGFGSGLKVDLWKGYETGNKLWVFETVEVFAGFDNSNVIAESEDVIVEFEDPKRDLVDVTNAVEDFEANNPPLDKAVSAGLITLALAFPFSV